MNIKLTENEDKLVEKISCYQAFKESQFGTEDKELTDKEQKCLQWLIVMLDIDQNNGSVLIRDGNDNSVLKTLFEPRDWSQGPDTELALRYSDNSEANYKFQEAGYCWKNDEAFKRIGDSCPSVREKPELNGVSFIEDYDLSRYHDQPKKFEREEEDGEKVKKIEQALFFLPLILPNDGVSKSAGTLNADALIEKGFFIHKDQVCPKEIGRPLVFHYTSSALKLEHKKATCKVRVRALDNGEGKTDVKSYERARVLWASVMIKAGKGKMPKENAWNAVKRVLDDVNDWGELEGTELDGEKQITLHKAEWRGMDKTFAYVEFDLKGLSQEDFYSDGKNHFYIFPIAIAPKDKSDKYTKLGTPYTGWKEKKKTPSKKKILAEYAVTIENILAQELKVLYRLDYRPPEVILNKGFLSSAGRTEWANSIYGNQTIFTSKSLRGISNFARESLLNEDPTVEPGKEKVIGELDMKKELYPDNKECYVYKIDLENLDGIEFLDVAHDLKTFSPESATQSKLYNFQFHSECTDHPRASEESLKEEVIERLLHYQKIVAKTEEVLLKGPIPTNRISEYTKLDPKLLRDGTLGKRVEKKTAPELPPDLPPKKKKMPAAFGL